MRTTELIAKHADNIPLGKACGHNDCPDMDCEWIKDHEEGYRQFAIELLETIYPSGATNATEVLKNVEMALDEMRKKDVKA